MFSKSILALHTNYYRKHLISIFTHQIKKNSEIESMVISNLEAKFHLIRK